MSYVGAPSDTVPIDGDKMRQFRLDPTLGGGVSQYGLARRASLSRGFISDIELGRRQPRMLAARSIAEALGVTVADLLRDERP